MVAEGSRGPNDPANRFLGTRNPIYIGKTQKFEFLGVGKSIFIWPVEISGITGTLFGPQKIYFRIPGPGIVFF